MIDPTSRRGLLCAGFFIAALPALAPAARADSPDRRLNTTISGAGTVAFLAAGVGLPLLSDGRDGARHALRAADSLLVSTALTEGLKALTREKRPDSNAHDSFPSGHASSAFSVATVEAGLHPRQAPWWYLGASVIGASRVRLCRHTVGDVLAGAALGIGTARAELAQPRGLILSPFITPDGGGAGVQVTRGL